MSDLDVIDPAGMPVDFRGRLFHVKPLKVGQLPAFARAIQPLGGVVQGIASGTTSLDASMLLGVVANHGEALVLAINIATGIAVEDLNESTPDKLIEVVVAVLKVNADFFKGRLTPAILGAVKKAMPAASPGAGQIR